MKRGIKFRAWDPKTQKLYYNIQNMYDGVGDEEEWSGDKIYETNIPRQSFGAVLKEETIPVMQYTGLKDKNGKDCYEGDLVRRSEFNDVVDIVYREDWGAFAFHAKHTTGRGEGWSHMYLGHAVHSWEIIGNIYENERSTK